LSGVARGEGAAASMTLEMDIEAIIFSVSNRIWKVKVIMVYQFICVLYLRVAL